MINVPDSKKQQLIANLIRMNMAIEVIYSQRIRPMLGRQYLDAAKLVENGITNITIAVDKQGQRFIDILYSLYIRVANSYYKLVSDSVNDLNNTRSVTNYYKKDAVEDEFNNAVARWARVYAAEEVVNINNTTKGLLKKLIEVGINDGKSYREIAKDIRKVKDIANNNRALLIATTEAHTASTFSTDQAIRVSNVDVAEKEWITAGDERVRTAPFSHVAANGERVGMEEYFTNTGEALRFPGDPRGSASNIIRCRCVTLYYTQ